MPSNQRLLLCTQGPDRNYPSIPHGRGFSFGGLRTAGDFWSIERSSNGRDSTLYFKSGRSGSERLRLTSVVKGALLLHEARGRPSSRQATWAAFPHLAAPTEAASPRLAPLKPRHSARADFQFNPSPDSVTANESRSNLLDPRKARYDQIAYAEGCRDPVRDHFARLRRPQYVRGRRGSGSWNADGDPGPVRALFQA